MTEFTPPPDENAEAFGAALATVAAVEAWQEGLTRAELNEIGRRVGEAIKDAARQRREGGLSEEDARTWLRTAARTFVESLRNSGRH